MRSRDSIITYSGHTFSPFKPDVEAIDIRDVAHALARIGRANGHFVEFYSVGQHCLDCAREARDMMVNTMREVMQVANAEGIDLNEEDVQGWLTIADGLNPEGMPSMRQDGMAKRYSEVELFSGTVIPLAQKHGIDVPNCRELYQRIKAVEAAY